MYIDSNIGGRMGGAAGADIHALTERLRTIERIGFDGVWSTEVEHDPFLPLAIAASQVPKIQLGTGVAIALARNPMTMAQAANDLQSFSGGRFILGLGTQIKAHIERRFSMPWSSPAERIEEYVSALRAIWHCWQTGETLDFQGRFYRHTLMTPMFTPEPHTYGSPQVAIAAVGPKMTRVAARVADGLLIHGFTTERYLREVTLPLVEETLSRSGRTRADFFISYPGLVASGRNEEEISSAIGKVRRQIAFYGATPAYRNVLELHGWGDLHDELNRLSKTGQWSTMTSLIDDEVLDTFAVVAHPQEAGTRVAARFSGLIDRFTVFTPYDLDEESAESIVTQIRIGSRSGPASRL
ncbi:luciferase family protein [Mycobacteroides abscessus]|uniref:LLM class F420-dependent oxidoreductase n=3 Tax=Mycobacteroides abscessus TaxID=36809 RepID=UPI0005DE1248|nr:LLM class F420-dependent oxidoreductase [Mycobacteroides abscessus]CPT92163.1 luciferase family protein [Mycobacteroides abscessus]CPW40949.1 luciferase family protein [Mycobacteroides abscessus]